MATIVLRMAQGAPEEPVEAGRESALVAAPPLLLTLAVLLLGVWVPPCLSEALHSVAHALGGL
jgi:hypothetical protein